MNPQNRRPLSGLLVFACALTAGPAAALSPQGPAAPCVPVNERPVETPEQTAALASDVALLRGGWSASIRQDTGEQLPADAPVVVASLSMLTGNGERRGLKAHRGGLCNKSEKAVRTVKLGWLVVPAGERDRVLLRGETPALSARVPPGRMLFVDFPGIDFGSIARPLASGGSLEGAFVLRLHVAEVEFEDGSNWRAVRSD